MKRLRITRRALRDLDEIAEYIGADAPESAYRLIARFRLVFHGILETPDIGRRRSDLRRNLRALPEGKCVIFYRKRRGGIEILRVLHGARDLRHIWRAKDSP